MLFILALVGSRILLVRMFGRVGGALATGGVIGFLTWLLIGTLIASVAAGILAFVVAIIGGFGGGGPGGGGSGWYSRRHGGGWGYPGGFGGGWRWIRRRRRRGLWRGRRRLRRRRRLGRMVSSMDWRRSFRHVFSTRRSHRLAFPISTLDAIEAAITASEKLHSAEIRFAIEGSLSRKIPTRMSSSAADAPRPNRTRPQRPPEEVHYWRSSSTAPTSVARP